MVYGVLELQKLKIMNTLKYSFTNELMLFVISILPYSLRQNINFDFLEKMNPYWLKRFAIEFKRRKKGKVVQKLRKIFLKAKTKQLRSFDAALAEFLLIEKDQRREGILAKFICSRARTISQYAETLDHVAHLLVKTDVHMLLDKLYDAIMEDDVNKFTYQSA